LTLIDLSYLVDALLTAGASLGYYKSLNAKVLFDRAQGRLIGRYPLVNLKADGNLVVRGGIFFMESELPRVKGVTKLYIWEQARFQKSSGDIQNPALLELFRNSEKLSTRRFLPPNHVLLALPDSLKLSLESQRDLGLQKMRQLLGINGLPSLQIQETLGFFNQHPDLLDDAGYRGLLKLFIVDGGLLVEDMMSPELASSFMKQIHRFCEDNYAKNIDLDKLEQAIFFLEIEQIVVRHLKTLNIHVDAHLIDIEVECEKLLIMDGTPRPISYLLHRLLVKHYATAPVLTTDGLTHLLIHAIHLSLYYPEEIPATVGKDVDTRDLIQTRQEEIYQLLQGPQQQNILNRVVRHFSPEIIELSWPEDSFPIYESLGSMSAIINVMEGSYTSYTSNVQLLPPSIVKDVKFIEIFGEKQSFKGRQTGWSKPVFDFTDDKNVNYRVIKSYGGLRFERQFGADWAVKIDLKKFSRGIDVLEESVPSFLYKTTFIWKRGGTSITFFATDKATRELLYEIELRRTLITDTVIDHLTDSKGKEQEYTYPKPRYSDATFIIHRLDVAGKRSGLVVANLSQCSFAPALKSFEDPAYIVALQDLATGEVKSIEFPRYGLTFNVKRDEKTDHWIAETPKMEGFTIAEVQGIHALRQFNHYLIMEKLSSKGGLERRVLIPDLLFRSFEENPNESTLAPPQFIKSNENQSVQIFEYTVNPRTGELEPATEAGRLLLAMNYLWKQEYDLAKKCLDNMPAIQALNKEESFLLLRLITIQNNDPHPRAIGLKIKACARYLQNSLDFLHHMYTTGKRFDELYSSYIDNLEHLETADRLTREEEVIILNTVGNNLNFSHRRQMVGLEINYPASLQGQVTTRYSPLVDQYDFDQILNSIRDRLDQAFRGLLNEPAEIETTAVLDERVVDFMVLYAEFRRLPSLTNGELEKIVEKLTNLPIGIQVFSREHLLNMIRSALNIKTAGILDNRHNNFPNDVFLALILLGVLDDPNQFPSLEELKHAILNKGDHDFAYTKEGKAILEGIEYSPPFARKRILFDTDPKEVRLKAIPQENQEIPGRCIRLLDNPFNLRPFIGNIDDYIAKAPFGNVVVAEMGETTEGLIDALSQDTAEYITKRELNSIKSLVRTVAPIPKQPLYAIKDIGALHNFRLDLQEAAYLGATLLSKEREAIELLANRPFPDPSRQAGREARLAAGVELPIDIDEAIRLFLHADTAFYRRRNEALSVDDTVMLARQVQSYLESATHNQHLSRLATAIEQLEHQVITKAPEGDLQGSMQEVRALATARRAYKSDEHPMYLVFEYYMNLIMRRGQVDNIDKVVNNLVAVIEMIMGAGKTSVILPLLGQMNADGKHISMGIFPDALMKSMASAMHKTIKGGFDKTLEVMEFDRKSILTAPLLEHIYRRLCAIRDDRKILLMSSSSVHGLYLKFVEKIDFYVTHLKKTNEGTIGSWIRQMFSKDTDTDTVKISMERELTLFRKIMALIHDSGSAILDEIDTILNVLRSSHYTINEAKALQTIYSTVVTDLYVFLESSEAINTSINLGFSSSTSSEPFTKDSYETIVKPLLIQAIFDGKLGKNVDGLH
ncbi:MAG: DUF3638 domain-containing protein, partial [Parachlamydiaceae bacterium]